MSIPDAGRLGEMGAIARERVEAVVAYDEAWERYRRGEISSLSGLKPFDERRLKAEQAYYVAAPEFAALVTAHEAQDARVRELEGALRTVEAECKVCAPHVAEIARLALLPGAGEEAG